MDATRCMLESTVIHPIEAKEKIFIKWRVID
jgi:hypothetical protein